MRLDPVDHEDTVRPGGQRVHVDGYSLGKKAHFFHFHAGTHRAADAPLSDAQLGQGVGLSLRRGPSMTAHGRDDEGGESLVPEPGGYGGYHFRQAADAARAYGQGDGTALGQRCLQTGRVHALTDGAGHIEYGVVRIVPDDSREFRDCGVLKKIA